MIKSNTIENKFLRVRTLNIGATLFYDFNTAAQVLPFLNVEIKRK